MIYLLIFGIILFSVGISLAIREIGQISKHLKSLDKKLDDFMKQAKEK